MALEITDSKAHLTAWGGRAQSYSPPSRRSSLSATFEPATHDRACLIALYRSTHGGKTWRNSRGWPIEVSLQRPQSVRTPAQGEKRFVNATTIVSSTSTGCSPQRPGSIAHLRPLARRSNANPFAPQNPFAGDVPAAVSRAPAPVPAENISSREKNLPLQRTCHNPCDVPAAANTAQKPPFSPIADTIEVPLILEGSSADSGKGNERLISPQAVIKSSGKATPLRSLAPLSSARVNTGRRSTLNTYSPASFKEATSSPERYRKQNVKGGGDRNRKHIQEVRWYGVSLGTGNRVTELKLSDNGLAGTLSENLGGLEMMRYLNIGRNFLTGPIPEGVWNLLNLEWLNATENALSGSMSPAMSNLTQLVELNLSSNRLSGCLPREVCTMRALTTLQLSHNALTGSLPIEISNLTALVTLGLDHNCFTGQIPPGVSGMRGLIELRLDHNALTGRIPLGMGKMTSLKILFLSHNKLRGSMPEGLVSRLGARKVQDFIMPGNRLADVDTALLLLRRPLACRTDRGLLCCSLFTAYLDVGTDMGAAATFYQGNDMLSFSLAVIFIIVPTSIIIASTCVAQGRTRKRDIFLTILQLRVLSEALQSLKQQKETREYKSTRFVEACFETAPQMLIQTVALASAWNDQQAHSGDVIVFVSVLISVFSLSWEIMTAFDRKRINDWGAAAEAHINKISVTLDKYDARLRGWAEEMVSERARQGRSWPGGASVHRWLVLILLWVFHVCEVGWRGISLAVLALALQGWAALVLLGAWGIRILVAKFTEASDLRTTKVVIKALAACLLDSVWDSRQAYILASCSTLVESSTFFVIAAVELNRGDTALEQALSETAWVAGSVYAVRCAVDILVRAPLHWGQWELFDWELHWKRMSMNIVAGDGDEKNAA